MRLLDGDLYDGTAGIGLFLAHAAAATSDAGLARAARGALAHALGRAEAGALGHVGLWTGSPGVVLCALSAATALHDDALTDRGAALLSRHSLPIPESASLDLLSGSAGCAIALLIAAAPLDAPGLHDRALLHGERLLATARRCAGAWSWSPDRTPGRPEPRSTGLAHGAAGIAHALIELHAASGDDRFLEAACGARVHESEHLRAAFAARADHRRGGLAQDPHAPTPPRRAPAPVVGWCNGVSGMALQRARAHLVLGGQTWLNDAQIAHETVASALVRHRAGSELRDTSLCHGAAGVIATVLETSSIVGDSAAGDIASQALTEAVVRYGRAARRWPGGLRGGWTPGLMLGDAGVGHLLLRSAGLAVPDVLLPSAASWFGSDDM
jgi:lantibiotic modifying enzyme